MSELALADEIVWGDSGVVASVLISVGLTKRRQARLFLDIAAAVHGALWRQTECYRAQAGHRIPSPWGAYVQSKAL